MMPRIAVVRIRTPLQQRQLTIALLFFPNRCPKQPLDGVASHITRSNGFEQIVDPHTNDLVGNHVASPLRVMGNPPVM
jgi:hypothetical protein